MVTHIGRITITLVITVRIITILGKKNHPCEEILGEFKKIKPPTFNGEIEKREESEPWLSRMKKYFQIYNYSNQLKARMAIYNLTGKAYIWWQELKRGKGIKEKNINWSTFKKIL